MWPDDARSSHPLAACARLLESLLVEPETLLAALAPEGWVRSPLVLVFHPTREQLAKEAERFRTNLARLRRAVGRDEEQDLGASESNPVMDEGFAEDDLDSGNVKSLEPPKAIEPEHEVVELLGYALWDVFSDNHQVVDGNEVAYDLGSFRGSAGFIADSINRRYTQVRRAFDYLDFYMGSSWVGGRADLRPVYRWIFDRLKDEGCRWIYSFPRIYLIDFGGRTGNDDPTSYDPSEAVRAEIEQAEHARERDALASNLEREYEEAVRRARHAPLPATVEAYRDVFGTLPEGWPHPEG